MKVLLDEGVPRQLTGHLAPHEVTTVPEAGWSGVKNGKLLALASDAGYHVFLSCDQALGFQQGSLDRQPFATLVLTTNHWPTMQKHIDIVLSAIDASVAGQVIRVDCGRFIPRRFYRGPV